MITKELSTQGLQFFQGVLHFSGLRLRAIEQLPQASLSPSRAWEAGALLSLLWSAGTAAKPHRKGQVR